MKVWQIILKELKNFFAAPISEKWVVNTEYLEKVEYQARKTRIPVLRYELICVIVFSIVSLVNWWFFKWNILVDVSVICILLFLIIYEWILMHLYSSGVEKATRAKFIFMYLTSFIGLGQNLSFLLMKHI